MHASHYHEDSEPRQTQPLRPYDHETYDAALEAAEEALHQLRRHRTDSLVTQTRDFRQSIAQIRALLDQAEALYPAMPDFAPLVAYHREAANG